MNSLAEGQETQSRLVRQSALGDAEQRARQLFEEHYGKSLPMGVELRSMRRNQEQRGVRCGPTKPPCTARLALTL